MTALAIKATMSFDRSKMKEKVSLINLDSDKEIDDLNLDFLFDYKIFPPRVMSYSTQWEQEKRKMEIGDNILQQIFLPPAKFFSLKIIVGVRINNIIKETNKRGFSYVTLVGHVERGESIFTIEKTNSGLIFKIQTYSEPGNLLTKLGGPIFTLPYQRYCTRKALDAVKKQMELKNVFTI
jgi:hypothetical protein